MTENPLGYEKISKLLKEFAIPSILAALVGSLYNIVEGIKIIQGKLEHNKKRFPIPGAFLQHVFGDLIPLICCEAVKII